jgi:hypothetical protein
VHEVEPLDRLQLDRKNVADDAIQTLEAYPVATVRDLDV